MALSAIPPPSPPIQMKEPQPFFGWGFFICLENMGVEAA
jgi:hypothetical protein